MRSILAQLCRELDAKRAKMGVAVVGTVVLGAGCGGVVEDAGKERPDAAQDARADTSPNDASDTGVAEAGQDVFIDVVISDVGDMDVEIPDGLTPVYMSACLPPDPKGDPAG